MTTIALSSDTLERLARFVEVVDDFNTWRASLPEDERALVSQFDTRVLVWESRSTEKLPVITNDMIADMPVASDLVAADTPVPVDAAATLASAPAPAKKEGRGRPRKTVQ